MGSDNNEHSKVVTRMMRAFNLNYTGFQIDVPEKREDGSQPPSIKAKQWEILLAQFDPEVLQQTTLHIVATRKNEYNWAPDIATVREQALNLSSGLLTTPTGTESWERVLKKVAEPPGEQGGVILTEEDKETLFRTIGGNAVYDLKHGNVRDLSFARKDYISTYDALIAKQRLEMLTPPSVKALIESRKMQSLPSPPENHLPTPSDEPKTMTFDEACAEFGDEMNILKGMIGSEE